jgi:hypothetical protein
MKRIGNMFPIFFALLLISSFAKGQKNEIGFSLGGFNYTGELAPVYNVLNYRPGGSIFYRLNLNPIIALRGSIHAGYIHANEKNSPRPSNSARAAYFTTFVTEAAIMAEYNFFNYRGRKEDHRLSPYLTGGIAVFNSQNRKISNVNSNDYIVLSIPMGIGLKYKLSRQMNLGFEFVARKTFTDRIDGVSSFFLGKHETANIFDKDWYYYTGFTLSYTFYGIKCNPDVWSKSLNKPLSIF